MSKKNDYTDKLDAAVDALLYATIARVLTLVLAGVLFCVAWYGVSEYRQKTEQREQKVARLRQDFELLCISALHGESVDTVLFCDSLSYRVNFENVE